MRQFQSLTMTAWINAHGLHTDMKRAINKPPRSDTWYPIYICVVSRYEIGRKLAWTSHTVTAFFPAAIRIAINQMVYGHKALHHMTYWSCSCIDASISLSRLVHAWPGRSFNRWHDRLTSPFIRSIAPTCIFVGPVCFNIACIPWYRSVSRANDFRTVDSISSQAHSYMAASNPSFFITFDVSSSLHIRHFATSLFHCTPTDRCAVMRWASLADRHTANILSWCISASRYIIP